MVSGSGLVGTSQGPTLRDWGDRERWAGAVPLGAGVDADVGVGVAVVAAALVALAAVAAVAAASSLLAVPELAFSDVR